MKVKPRADTAEVFTTWINEYVESQRTGNPPIPPKPVKLPIQQPRISIFTGVNTRGELAFDLWKYEVKRLLRDKSYFLDVIVSIIRKSLRGKAGRVTMRLGPSARIGDLMDKLESILNLLHRINTDQD